MGVFKIMRFIFIHTIFSKGWNLVVTCAICVPYLLVSSNLQSFVRNANTAYLSSFPIHLFPQLTSPHPRPPARKGSNCFYLCFIGVGRGPGEVQFTGGFLPFWKPENVLSPGGTLHSRARKGSNCFYFTFYWCRKRYRGFQFTGGFLPFWELENVLSPGGTMR